MYVYVVCAYPGMCVCSVCTCVYVRVCVHPSTLQAIINHSWQQRYDQLTKFYMYIFSLCLYDSVAINLLMGVALVAKCVVIED